MFFDKDIKDQIQSMLYQMSELQKRIEKLEGEQSPEVPMLTNPTPYTDPSGEEGTYRRIGNSIEFTATYPPQGIDIKTNTLLFIHDDLKSAQVHGWENKTVIAEASSVFANIKNGVIKNDTRNFVENDYFRTNITAPVSGIYTGEFEIFMNKGDELVINKPAPNDFKRFQIKRES